MINENINQTITAMYTANSPKELKKLLKNNDFPISITDPKTIKVVQYMEHRKTQKCKTETTSTIANTITPTNNVVISGPVILGLGIIAAITAISIYTLYKDKNIKVTYGAEGGITLETF